MLKNHPLLKNGSVPVAGRLGWLAINVQLGQFERDDLQIETTKLTQELAVKLEQGETFVSGTQWQTEK